MKYPHLISATVSKNDLKEVLGAIDFINEKLPDLETISKEELSTLPKVGKETVNFVLENLKEAKNHAELVPANIDLGEVIKDAELIKAIHKILAPLKKLERKLEDSALLAGSDAYLPSIAIYNAMKADAIKRKNIGKKVRF